MQVAGGSSAFLSFINSATAYVNITSLLGNSASSFQNDIVNALESSASSLVPSTDSTVIEGYKAIYNVSARDLLMSPLGHVEILLSLTTSTVAVQAALQRPFRYVTFLILAFAGASCIDSFICDISQGYLYINSSDPFDTPVIDPRYLTHSAGEPILDLTHSRKRTDRCADITLLREGLKFARSVAQTAPLNQSLTGEVTPGSSVSTDDDWDKWLANNVGTEFHPSCSCAMLPLSQGGVVDTDLRVYGLGESFCAFIIG